MEEGQNFISQKSITVDDLTVTYRNGHTALRSASFSIPEGSITGLVGVNGSGKSTLFKALMGFIPIARGKVSLLGHSVKDALKKNLIAYVPQSEEVDWDFPVLVKDVVLMGRYGKMGIMRRARPEDLKVVAEALRRVGMLDFEDRQIGELSGGGYASYSPSSWKIGVRCPKISFCGMVLSKCWYSDRLVGRTFLYWNVLLRNFANFSFNFGIFYRSNSYRSNARRWAC